MEPDEIFETQDGSHSIQSKRFGVSYHSKYGAIQESRHVFIEAGLYYKALQQKDIAILELGFGTGLNTLLTYQEAERHGWTIFYETIEAYPITLAQANQLNYPALLGATSLQAVFQTLHTSTWSEKHIISPHFTFQKQKKAFQDIDYQAQFDLIYFDAFAPGAQPELWEVPLLQKLYNALRLNGILVTYCAKGSVKRNFREVGFKVEALPGPPGKREMTRCIKPAVNEL
ncbi:MAG: tRNA (5-methylaminomethyl-2-thiouridine)(34)-methyltransferase MnmD [Saprospiraceae bacterium]